MIQRGAATAILGGGLAAGVLDIVYAMVFWGLRGVSPGQVLQSVAGGVFGQAAYAGGAATAAAGLALHLLISVVAAAVFWLAAARAPALVRRPFLWGPLFGLGVWTVMNLVVVPLSASPLTLDTEMVTLVGSLLAHGFLFGLPIALFARRALLRPPSA